MSRQQSIFHFVKFQSRPKTMSESFTEDVTMGSQASSSSQPSPIPTIHLLLMEDKHVDAFNAAREKYDLPSNVNIVIHNCTLRDLPQSTTFDAIVSPANSFARIDGAFDDALSRAFAPKQDYHALTRVAQATVYKKWRGFAPPGTCTLVDMGADEEKGLRKGSERWDCRYLLLCPTMKIPQDVRWDREVVYECIWSLLNAVENHNNSITGTEDGGIDGENGEKWIESLLMTPLATGCGLVSAQRWAEQAVLAIKHFVDAVSGGPTENRALGDKWKNMGWFEAMRVTKEVGKTYGLRDNWEVVDETKDKVFVQLVPGTKPDGQAESS